MKGGKKHKNMYGNNVSPPHLFSVYKCFYKLWVINNGLFVGHIVFSLYNTNLCLFSFYTVFAYIVFINAQ